MKILLTGATGFIGSHLLQALIEEKHDITILLRESSNTWRINNWLPKVRKVQESDLRSFFSQSPPETIIHLATHYAKTHQPEDVEKMIDGNIKLPTTLLEFASLHKHTAFINIGTCFEYAPSGFAISECSDVQPYNLYASTKLAFEEILKFYATETTLRAITLRLFFPYGEDDNDKVIPLMIKSILSGKTMTISKGEQYLDFTYVGDIVQACLKSIAFISSNQYRQYELFNIGEGKAKQLKQIATLLNQMSGKELIRCENPYSKNEIMNMMADISKAKKMLHWVPQTSIETGLEKTYHYYTNHEKTNS